MTLSGDNAAQMSDVPAFPCPDLAVVVPLRDEEENVIPLLAEIEAALSGKFTFEAVFVDDGSTDSTPAKLLEAKARFPWLKTVRHASSCGQSVAIVTGVKIARAPLIATLDGDGQNDPADIPLLLAAHANAGKEAPSMIAGWRTKRKDTWLKRISSKLANAIRSSLLGDNTPDTGCGLKIFPRETFLDFPRFNHMHRFLPALMLRQGGKVVSVPVNHRPRERGASKYGFWDRLWVGVADILGVMWLRKRPVRPVIEP
jgi:dolichol-phosphate mannosyltransferase